MINFPIPDQEIVWYLPDQKEVIEFEEGLSNSTYLVVNEGRKYVVRDFHSKKNVSDSFRELWMMQLAAEIGIAPKIVHVDLKQGYVVIDYIEGHHPDVGDEDLKQAVRQLKKFHQQEQYEPFSSIYEGYRLIHLDDMTRLDKAITVVQQIETVIKKYGCTFCHLDFHTKNIIQGNDGSSWVIDWECAGLAHPYYDIAKLTHNFPFDDALDLLAEYLEKPPTESQKAQFFIIRAVVYMSIATNRYVRGETEVASSALDDFLEIISSETFQEQLHERDISLSS